MNYRTAAIAAVACTGVLLASCSATEGGASDAAALRGANVPSEVPQTEPPTLDEPEPKVELAYFGQTYEWADGMALTVSQPEPFKPSRFAAADKGDHVRFTVTIVNGTGKTYDPASYFWATMQSGNREASEIFDSARGLDGLPGTSILPGREAQFDVGFTVLDPRDLVYEVQPSVDHDPAYFVSQ